MPGVIAARHQGDDYQAKWFWIQACRLFDPESRIIKVSYEANDIKSFDDVVVHFEDTSDENGNYLCAKYYQVKFHVTSAGALIWKNIIDPKFINASSFSILQRLKNAQKKVAPNGTEANFILYSPWQIHPDDPLATIHALKDGKLDWERLSRGSDRSTMGIIRATWREHLEVKGNEELELILRHFRILQGKTLEELNEELNSKLPG